MSVYSPCKCGCKEFYRNVRVSGISTEWVDCNGKMTDNNESLHDHITYKSSKKAKCSECHSPAILVKDKP